MSTMLSTVSHQFSALDRARGLDCVLERRVSASQIGEKGVVGRARGASNVHYNVCLDLRNTADSQLGGYCSCQRFSEVGTCQHLFGLIRLIESQTGLSIANQEWSLFRSTPYQFEFGRRIAVVQSPGSIGTHWLLGLAQLKQFEEQQLSAGGVHGRRPFKPSERLLYVLDLSQLADSQRFYFEPMVENRSEQDKPTCRRIVVNDEWIEQLSSSADKQLLKLLTIDEMAADNRSNLDDYEIRSHSSQAFTDYYDQLDDSHEFDEEHGDEDYNARADHTPLSLTLSDALAERTLQALAETGRFYWTMDLSEPELYQPIAWEEPKWKFVMEVVPAEQGGYAVNGRLRRADAPPKTKRKQFHRSLSDVVGICETGAVLFENTVTVLPERDVLLLRACRDHGGMSVGHDELDAFLSRVVAVIPPEQLELPKGLSTDVVLGQPRCRVVLRAPRNYSDAQLEMEIEIMYGEEVIPAESPLRSIWDAASKSFVVRNMEREHELRGILLEHPAVEESVAFASERLFVFRKYLPKLVADLAEREIEVFADGKLQRSGLSYSLSVSSGEDWFDLETEVRFGETPVPFPTLLSAIRAGRKVIRLDDGSEGILPEDWLKKFGGMAELGTEEDGKLRFRPSQALMLDAWLENQPAKRDTAFKKWVKKLNGFNGIKAQQEPVTFQGELREYQRDGLGWFKFLEEFRFGGCLADDMGLGKTIQVLALLERRRLQQQALRKDVKPSIAIVPKSLVYNWVAEAAKFAPELKVIDYTGAQRKESVDELQAANLIVTTYATFRLDVEMLKEIEFDYAILDEAQAIKNPNCQATKAVRLLKADYRLAMTGTPIENHLGDLWSILNFTNPGLLGNLKPTYFSRSGDDPEASARLETLGRALKPFILRRTKAQVLTELPEKSEQILYCDMTPKQNKHYQELRKYYAQNLKKTVAEVGLNKAKIQVLEALLRLRQVACDPRLVSPKERSCGAKITMLVEQLEEMMSEGHKALVFSQFTSMLALVRQELDKRKWKYEYLDGSSTRRGASVKRFQEDPNCPLFLISLKAGGHGLNLTAADYVYILDPWWNPAVEAQAVDRAHRMGQQKPVMAYRVIARDTVEEKICHMQESKKKLAEAVISSDQSLLRNLSMDDLRILFE